MSQRELGDSRSGPTFQALALSSGDNGSGISLRYIVDVGGGFHAELAFPVKLNRAFHPISSSPWLSSLHNPTSTSPHHRQANYSNSTPNTLKSLQPLPKRYRSRRTPMLDHDILCWNCTGPFYNLVPRRSVLCRNSQTSN